MSVTLFRGGTVVTNPETGATETALLSTDGLVTHLGEAALAEASRADDIVELAGDTVIPGVGDGHCHPLFGAYEQLGPDIGQARSVEQIVDAVRDWIADHPDAEWVLAGSYDITLADGGEFDARWLDRATGDTPTVLRAFDHHTVWVNSAALDRAGITADTPDPELGVIVRRADGSPLGTLKEAAANRMLDEVVPPRPESERVWAIAEATRRYAAQGTTWIQDAWVEPLDVAAYLAAAAQDRLSTRVNLALRADPFRWREQVREFTAARDRVTALAHPLLTANTVKFFMDGVIEGRTALLEEPYAVDADNTGIGNWEAAELAAATRAMSDAGFQLHLHAIGDRANRLALDAVAALDPAARRACPPVIAHVALVDPRELPRYTELGVIANFEPFWAQNDAIMRDLTEPFLGDTRQHWQYPIGTLVRAGGTVSFGSDWPVTTADWRQAMAVAITHVDPAAADADTREPWLPEQRISAQQAFAAYTLGIARQALTTARGRLEIGCEADLAQLSANPVTTDPHRIPDITVRGTWIAGQPVYRAERAHNPG